MNLSPKSILGKVRQFVKPDPKPFVPGVVTFTPVDLAAPKQPCACGHPEMHQTSACPALDPKPVMAGWSPGKYVGVESLKPKPIPVPLHTQKFFTGLWTNRAPGGCVCCGSKSGHSPGCPESAPQVIQQKNWEDKATKDEAAYAQQAAALESGITDILKDAPDYKPHGLYDDPYDYYA